MVRNASVSQEREVSPAEGPGRTLASPQASQPYASDPDIIVNEDSV